MIPTETIILKIKGGLRDCALKYNIKNKDLALIITSGRDIKISMIGNDGKANIIDICTLFKVSPVEKMLFVAPYLKKTISAWAKKKNIDEAAVNVKIFAKDADFYPGVILQNYNHEVVELTIKELLN